MTSLKSKSTNEAANVAAYIRARCPLLVVMTKEESRVERYLIEAANAAGYMARLWDIAAGITNSAGIVVVPESNEPDAAMIQIEQRARGQVNDDRCVWIMRDMLPWLTGPMGVASQRRLRNLARLLPTTNRDRAQCIILLCASGELPAELAAHATVIDWPLPDKQEIADMLDAALRSLPQDVQRKACSSEDRACAIEAAVGLSGEEVAACFARSLVKLRKIDPVLISNEKKRVISREKVLEWNDPLAGGLSWVGGLEHLKAWLLNRASAWTQAARDYGLPAPKGTLIVGVSGCGKSLIAKAIASAWGVPMIRFDLNGLRSKYVGESEGNLRKALRTIEAIGKCVVWVDEIEKAMQGATSGSADGGVAADALGTLLSWMQERQGEAFLIATANDVTSLPPELLRKGRFDEVWFVDLPSKSERVAIIEAALRQHKRKVDSMSLDANAVAVATDGFNGAEIAALVPEAMFSAFEDKAREIETADLIAAARNVVPLSKTADNKIARLRAWAKGRARRASIEESAGDIAADNMQIDFA